MNDIMNIDNKVSKKDNQISAAENLLNSDDKYIKKSENKKTGAVSVEIRNQERYLEVKRTEHGAKILQAIISKYDNIKERNEIIKDLSKEKMTQNQIAVAMDISQSTVSRVLKKE